MTYWELEKEPWEEEDNYDGAGWMTNRGRIERLNKISLIFLFYDGAGWMTNRGRIERLEKSYSLECSYRETD